MMKKKEIVEKHSRMDDSQEQPNAETIAALLEAECIEKDPNIKGYHDLDELFRDLKS